MNKNETTPLTPTVPSSKNCFHLVEAFNLAMDQALYMDPEILEYDGHYLYADLLEKHFGERFILGRMFTLSFTDTENSFPHMLIAHEHMNRLVFFALSLTLQDDEDLTLQYEVIGTSLKYDVENSMKLIEQYIQTHRLTFANDESIEMMNSLFANPFKS